MAVDFRGHPMFPPGYNSPTRFEADVYDCEVWGQIPSDLEGHFYRVQCDFVYRPPENEWMTGFNGDGHVSLFRFQNGSVDFRSRFVRTDRLEAEKAVRKRLFGVYRNHYTDDPSVANVDRAAANTHIYWHGGHMLVYKEDGLPYEIDPYTLETIGGQFNYNGQFKSETCSAHPKVDPVSGEMIAYGYQATGPLSDDVYVYTISPAGEVTREWRFKSPYIGIMHDIAITQKYIIVPVVTRTSSEARLRSGEPMWEWAPDKETMVAVLPREGDAKDIRWFRGPPRNTLHFLNATDDGDRITMELPVSDEERSPSHIKRWIFNMNSRDDRFGEEVVSMANGVLARMDDRYLSLPYRYCFVGNRNTERPYDTARGGNLAGRVTNEYKRVDVHTGKESTFFVGDTQGLQECMFAPRRKDSPEGDGYLLGIASNYAEMASELVIVDAQRMEEGAVATVKLPFRLRSGTHTNWFSAWDLALKGDRIV